MSRLRLSLVLLAAVSLLLGLTVWHERESQSGSVAELQQVATVRDFTNQLDSSREKNYLLGSIDVCLDRPGDVKITGVTTDSGKFPVVGVAARRAPQLAGRELVVDWPATLQSYDVGPVVSTLTVPCAGTLDFYELLLQVKAPNSTVSTDGFTVDYTSGERSLKLKVPYHLILCAQKTDAACLK